MKTRITISILLAVLSFFSYEASAEIAVEPVHSIADIPDQPPGVGHYRLHLIDVGTGLSILVQGHDWNLLFDAGSADDKSGNQMSGDSNSRVIAYLYKAIGPSGRRSCKPADDNWAVRSSDTQLPIDHMILSHPHEDHLTMPCK